MGVSDRCVRILCAKRKIPGAFREGRGWKTPIDAVKPSDGRFKSVESLLDRIDRKKAELDACRPLTEGEAARLTEEFTVEYTVYFATDPFRGCGAGLEPAASGLWVPDISCCNLRQLRTIARVGRFSRL